MSTRPRATGSILLSDWTSAYDKILQKQKSLLNSKITEYRLNDDTYGCGIGYKNNRRLYPLHEFHYDQYSHHIHYGCRTGYESIQFERYLYTMDDLISFLETKFPTLFETLVISSNFTYLDNNTDIWNTLLRLSEAVELLNMH